MFARLSKQASKRGCFQNIDQVVKLLTPTKLATLLEALLCSSHSTMFEFPWEQAGRESSNLVGTSGSLNGNECRNRSKQQSLWEGWDPSPPWSIVQQQNSETCFCVNTERVSFAGPSLCGNKLVCWRQSQDRNLHRS